MPARLARATRPTGGPLESRRINWSVGAISSIGATVRSLELRRIIDAWSALGSREVGSSSVATHDASHAPRRGDQARPGSDVDLLVEFDQPVGYFHVFEVQDRLDAMIGCKVDLVPRGGLRPEIRDRVLAEAVRAA